MEVKDTINKGDFFISEADVLEGLNFNKEELDRLLTQIENYSEEFDWEEGVHFRYINKTKKIKDFSRLGLITVSNYCELSEELSYKVPEIAQLLTRLISEEERKKIDIEVAEAAIKVVNDDSNKILVRRNRHWLNFRDVRKILKTTSPRLKQAFEDIARSELPLIIDEDFEDIDNDRYYSFSGIERISRELSQKLTKKYRRLFADRVPHRAFPIVEEDYTKKFPPAPSNHKIEKAKEEARKQQNRKCQITGEKSLTVHHLYDKSTYPEFAADPDNLLVIKQEIHHRFHTWHEGFDKPCTIEDFISFVKRHNKYVESPIILHKLDERRKKLDEKLKARSKFLHQLPQSEKTVSPTPAAEPQPTTSTRQAESESVPVSTNQQGATVTDPKSSLRGKTCRALIKDKEQEGKILAIAHYSSHKRICFQVNNERLGTWINESDLIGE